jgi:hypothetical protein
MYLIACSLSERVTLPVGEEARTGGVRVGEKE